MMNATYSTRIQRAAIATGSYPLLELRLFEESREIIGSQFTQIVGYYLEDTLKYLEQIEQDLIAGAYLRVMMPLNTIKSSSRQLGALALAELAATMEIIVRNAAVTGVSCPLELPQMLAQLRQQFETLKPVLADCIAPSSWPEETA